MASNSASIMSWSELAEEDALESSRRSESLVTIALMGPSNPLRSLCIASFVEGQPFILACT